MVRINPFIDFDPGAFPYMAHTGMCRWTGYGFRLLCPKQGYNFVQVSPKEGIYFRIFFILNRVRVSNHQRLTYTQIQVQYPRRDFDSMQTNL